MKYSNIALINLFFASANGFIPNIVQKKNSIDRNNGALYYASSLPDTTDPRIILNLEPDTMDIKKIKKAYRKLAMKHHPDSLPSDASEEEKQVANDDFAKINEAYATLCDRTSDDYRFSSSVYDRIKRRQQARQDGTFDRMRARQQARRAANSPWNGTTHRSDLGNSKMDEVSRRAFTPETFSTDFHNKWTSAANAANSFPANQTAGTRARPSIFSHGDETSSVFAKDEEVRIIDGDYAGNTGIISSVYPSMVKIDIDSSMSCMVETRHIRHLDYDFADETEEVEMDLQLDVESEYTVNIDEPKEESTSIKDKIASGTISRHYLSRYHISDLFDNDEDVSEEDIVEDNSAEFEEIVEKELVQSAVELNEEASAEEQSEIDVKERVVELESEDNEILSAAQVHFDEIEDVVVEEFEVKALEEISEIEELNAVSSTDAVEKEYKWKVSSKDVKAVEDISTAETDELSAVDVEEEVLAVEREVPEIDVTLNEEIEEIPIGDDNEDAPEVISEDTDIFEELDEIFDMDDNTRQAQPVINIKAEADSLRKELLSCRKARTSHIEDYVPSNMKLSDIDAMFQEAEVMSKENQLKTSTKFTELEQLFDADKTAVENKKVPRRKNFIKAPKSNEKKKRMVKMFQNLTKLL